MSSTTTAGPSAPTNNYPESSIAQRNPVVGFIIGLIIILISSLLNAGGLNLTKLDHIRTSALPKANRKKDFLRPLWVAGMLLYILSQLLGSTLALEYMRAEYVAPLGSTSLIFNFIFASFIGIPVTRWDIYGTVVVFLGVVGIVAFGSINSGLHNDSDLAQLSTNWARAGWLSYFSVMTAAIVIVFIGTAQLDAILVARADIAALPISRPPTSSQQKKTTVMGFIKEKWAWSMHWTRELLDNWTAAKDDKYVAWMLGLGWSCTGGALAGACLVFAKATVKLISLYAQHNASASQFAHPAAIITILLLAATAVAQIICLNRGLKVYNSTLVVPVFYGVYTASGFLNSLIFSDEVDAYKTWTLVCLGFSILVLIAGVVLLTHKKPEPKAPVSGAGDDAISLRTLGNSPRRRPQKGDDDWDIGASDEDDDDDLKKPEPSSSSARRAPTASGSLHVPYPKHQGEEGQNLISEDERVLRQTGTRLAATVGDRKLISRSPSLRSEDFGEWEDASHPPR